MSVLNVGDPVPWFTVRSSNAAEFHFDTVGGRHIVLTFFGSAERSDMRAMLDEFQSVDDVFDDKNACFFGVSNDAGDEREARVIQRVPGYRYFWDFDGQVAARYGLLRRDEATQKGVLAPVTYVLDPSLRVLGVFPITDPAKHAGEVLAFMRQLPDLQASGTAKPPAPILVVPRVFEPELCRELIELYHSQGGEESGFMQTDAQGRTVEAMDHQHKRRRDCIIEDDELKAHLRDRVNRRIVPEIRKAFQFQATRIERYIVACYDAADGGHFNAHRDNTTKGTAHRRFACTINLNAEDYEGGELMFREYDRHTYKAPTGGAVVFSCSLLHEATPVTKGTRYCFLPFLYDDPAARIREENLKYVASKNQPGGNLA